MAIDSEIRSELRDLVAILCDALDEYAAGGSDLAALVRDVDSVIEELAVRADPTWVENLTSQWNVLAGVLWGLPRRGCGRVGFAPGDRERVAAAVRGLRFLCEVWPGY